MPWGRSLVSNCSTWRFPTLFSLSRAHRLLVVPGPRHGLVHNLQDVVADQLALADDPNGSAVAVEYVAVGGELLELDLGELHEALHLVLGAVEVLDAERVYSYGLDAGLVANLHYLSGRDGWSAIDWDLIPGARSGSRAVLTNPSECLEAAVMTFYRLHTVISRIPPVAIHLKGHMLRDGPLLEGADEEAAKLLDGPFSRGRLQDKPAD